MADTLDCRRRRRGPAAAAVAVRPRSRRARHRRVDPRGAGVVGREHFRRAGRPAALGGGRRCPGRAGVSSDQHARCDGRLPLAAVRPVRLGCSAIGRPRQPRAGPAHRRRWLSCAAPLVGGSPTGAVRAWRRDAARHPSPNAGVVEAAFAGALGVRLGGPTRYPHGLEIRPTLGDGAAPTVDDLRRAIRLSRVVQIGGRGRRNGCHRHPSRTRQSAVAVSRRPA